MSTFRNAEHVYQVIGEFMAIPSRPRTIRELRQWWGDHPAYYEKGDEVEQINTIGRRIRDLRLIFEFHLQAPEAILTIDSRNRKRGENYSVIQGKSPRKPDLIIRTTGDIAHQFWGGQLSVPIALMTGKIKTNGSKTRALALLPRITPAFSLYPRYLELINEKRLLRLLKEKGNIR